MKTETKSLPESFRGGWSYHQPWSPGHQSPHFYGHASFTTSSFRISEGEQSKDSGHWTIRGTYTLLSGEGTEAAPYVLRLDVTTGGGKGTHGYPQEAGPAQSGDTIEGKMYLKDGVLHISLPRHSLEVKRAD